VKYRAKPGIGNTDHPAIFGEIETACIISDVDTPGIGDTDHPFEGTTELPGCVGNTELPG
jgi:hypothetical protein